MEESNSLVTLVHRGFRHFRNDMLEPYQEKRSLINTEATIFAPHIDPSKRQIAFGRWGVPKIRKELLNSDLTIARQALVTLLDFVHDPEKAQDVIRLNVLARMVRLIVSKDEFTRYHSLLVLNVLAKQPNGAKAITDKKFIIENLIEIISDENPKIRQQTAITIETLSKCVFAFTCMVENDFVQHLVSRIPLEEDPNVTISVLNALEALMNSSDKASGQAIECGLCDMIAVYLDHEDADIRLAAVDVMVYICIPRSGKLAAENCSTDVIAALSNLLDDINEDIVQGAALALSFLFVTTTSKLRGANLCTDMKLVPIALYSKKISLKVNAIQALINLAIAPAVKERLWSEMNQLKNINTLGSTKVFELVMRLEEVLIY